MRNMNDWIASLITGKKRCAMPITTSPGIPLIGVRPPEVFRSGELQFRAIQALVRIFPTEAAMTMMDLSVEAEAFGAPVRFEEREPPNITGPVVEDAADIDRLEVPPVGAGRTSQCLLAARLCAEKIRHRPTLGGMIGPFSLAGRLLEMNRLMLSTATDPSLVHALLEKCTRFLIEYAQAFKATGCHGILLAEPAAGLISAKMCQDFSADFIRRIVEAVQDEHFTVILHNCGRTEKQVPALLSTGASALHVGNAVDVTKILEQVPRTIPVMGNVDPSGVFLMGTPEDVFRTTFELLQKTKDYPNFVLSSGCDIPPGTTIENIQSFFAALEEYSSTDDH